MKHSKYSLVGWFIRQAMENKTIRIFGDGRQKRDYIYVDDMIDAMLAIAGRPLRGFHCFNLGTGSGIRFKDMVAGVLKTVGRGRVEYTEWPKNYMRLETGSFVADVTKLKKAGGWKPKIGLMEGIRRTYEYYRRFRKEYW